LDYLSDDESHLKIVDNFLSQEKCEALIEILRKVKLRSIEIDGSGINDAKLIVILKEVLGKNEIRSFILRNC
jgi:hypothetical protein